MAKSKAGAFAAGILVGSAIGSVVGLLVAPRSGRETRRILKKSADALPELAEDLSTSVQLQADRISESAVRNWSETLLRFQEAIAAGIEASQLQTQQAKQAREITADPNPSESHR